MENIELFKLGITPSGDVFRMAREESKLTFVINRRDSQHPLYTGYQFLISCFYNIYPASLEDVEQVINEMRLKLDNIDPKAKYSLVAPSYSHSTYNGKLYWRWAFKLKVLSDISLLKILYSDSDFIIQNEEKVIINAK